MRLVKCYIASKEAHQRWGGAYASYFDSICASNLGWWILNHLVTFSINSHQLIMWGHVVFISVINFCWQVIWMMKPVMIMKKHSLKTSFIMCSMTKSSWCAPHQIQVKGQSSCMATSSRMGNASNAAGHIVRPIRCQTNKTNHPIKVEHD